MGISERKQREKEQRRNDIIESAEKVFFSKGWTVATMDDVAADAELSKATLYLYFKSKEELYTAIFIRSIRILQSKFEKAVESKETGLEKIEAIGRAYVSFFYEYPNYVDAMQYCGFQITTSDDNSQYLRESEQLRQSTMGLVAGAIEKGVKDGTIRPDVEPMKAAVILWAQTEGLLRVLSATREDIESHFSFSASDVVEAYFDFTYHSLAADPRGGPTQG